MWRDSQRRLHEVIESSCSLDQRRIAAEMLPGQGKSRLATARAVYKAARGKTVVVVTPDRLLRWEYTQIKSSLIKDILAAPDMFPGVTPDDLERVRVRSVYGNREIPVRPRLEKFVSAKDLTGFPVLCEQFAMAIRFWSDGSGEPRFRTDFEQTPEWETFVLLYGNEFDTVFLSEGEKFPDWYIPYTRYRPEPGLVCVMTLHKLLFNKTMFWPKNQYTLLGADEIIIDEAHEIIRIGQGFTNMNLNLTEFCTAVGQAAKVHPSLTKYANTIRAVLAAARKWRNLSRTEVLPPDRPETKQAPLEQTPLDAAREKFWTQTNALIEMQAAKTTNNKFLIGPEQEDAILAAMTNVPNQNFWDLFDPVTAGRSHKMVNLQRRISIDEHKQVWLLTQAAQPGAVLLPLLYPRAEVDPEHSSEYVNPKRMVILLSGTLFMDSKSGKDGKDRFRSLLGLKRNDSVLLPCYQIAPDRKLARYRRANQIPSKTVFGDQIEFEGRPTYTSEASIRNWARDITGMADRRIGVLMASHADRRRLGMELIRTGTDPARIINSTEPGFVGRIIARPDGILLTTRTNGYNVVEKIIQPDGTEDERSLLTGLYLTRLPRGRDQHWGVRDFLGWTKTIQFLCRGARGDFPDWVVGLGDDRFSDPIYLPPALFERLI